MEENSLIHNLNNLHILEDEEKKSNIWNNIYENAFDNLSNISINSKSDNEDTEILKKEYYSEIYNCNINNKDIA